MWLAPGGSVRRAFFRRMTAGPAAAPRARARGPFFRASLSGSVRGAQKKVSCGRPFRSHSGRERIPKKLVSLSQILWRSDTDVPVIGRPRRPLAVFFRLCGSCRPGGESWCVGAPLQEMVPRSVTARAIAIGLVIFCSRPLLPHCSKASSTFDPSRLFSIDRKNSRISKNRGSKTMPRDIRKIAVLEGLNVVSSEIVTCDFFFGSCLLACLVRAFCISPLRATFRVLCVLA